MSKNKTTLVIDNKSFLIYKDFYETAKHLTNEQMGELFHAIFVWQISGEEEAVSPELNLTLKTLISQFKRDGQAYKDRCNKNRENIKKRWESESKKKIRSNTNVNDSIQTNTKRTYIDKDSDKDSVSDNPIISKWGERKQEAFRLWLDFKREKKQTYKKTGLNTLAKKVNDWDDVRLEDAVNFSIENNYSGLYESKDPKPDSCSFTPPTVTEILASLSKLKNSKCLAMSKEQGTMIAHQFINHYQSLNWIGIVEWEPRLENWVMNEITRGNIARAK